MITKTRLQFLAALFLAFLPFLGFPVWLDTILVSALGIFIAFTTFLTARERRLKSRSANMVDAPKEVDVKVKLEVPKPKRTIRKKPKIAQQEPVVPSAPVEGPVLKPSKPEEDLGPLQVVESEPQKESAPKAATPVVNDALHMEEDQPAVSSLESKEVSVVPEPKVAKAPVAEMEPKESVAIPSPIVGAESVLKKVSRRKAKTPVFVSEPGDGE